MRTYGITAEEYDAILDEQGGVCAICGKRPVSKMFSVDHDHKTMRIRGLIHGSPCNQLLGNARDDIVRLQAAIKYLKEPPAYSVLSAERIVPTPRIRRYRSYIGAS
jgi:formate dehydrogenase maturation protein FdhE